MSTPDAEDCFTAWDRFCDELRVLGHAVRESGAPDPADGLRHLSRLAVHGLQECIEHADPAFPTFHRFDDDVVKWGGPNVDNLYLRARVDAQYTYRLSGNVRGLRQAIVSIVEGDMHLEQYGVFAECDLGGLRARPDGSFELIVSAQPHDGPEPWLPLDPRASYLSIRQYFSDWDADRPGEFCIEALNPGCRAPQPLTPLVLAERVAAARVWMRAAHDYWGPFAERIDEQAGGVNRFVPPRGVNGGAEAIRYGGGTWDLAPSEALLVETEVPDADYWSVMLYSLPWFESLDIHNRQSSLTGHQVHVDDDGICRIVVAHEDPGLPNWLDTEGRSRGKVAWRWVRARDVPPPRVRVVRFAELGAVVPQSAGRMSAEERARVQARRRAHLARRFRR